MSNILKFASRFDTLETVIRSKQKGLSMLLPFYQSSYLNSATTSGYVTYSWIIARHLIVHAVNGTNSLYL